MKSFNSYLLLEKITKEQFSNAFQNNNVIIGAEFEFVSEDLVDVITDRKEILKEITDLYKLATKEYKTYQKAYVKWEQAVDKLEEKKSDDSPGVGYELKVLAEKIKNDPKYKMPAYFDYMDKVGVALSFNAKFYVGNFIIYNYQEPVDVENKAVKEYTRREADFKKSADLTKFLEGSPVRPYRVTGKNQTKEDNYWNIVQDGSVKPFEHGVEITSPPMPITEFLPKCEEMFKWIEKIGMTNSTCGFHLHMSLRNIPNLKDVLNPLKLVVLTDEGYIYKRFPSRINNYFARSMSTAPHKATLKDLIDPKEAKEKYFEKMFFYSKDTRYYGINFRPFFSSDNSNIEFRYMGGDYSQKFKEVKEVTGLLAHNLMAACEDQYMQKEYVQKLVRFKTYAENAVTLFEYDFLRLLRANREIWMPILAYYDDPNEISTLSKAERREINGLVNLYRVIFDRLEELQKEITAKKLRKAVAHHPQETPSSENLEAMAREIIVSLSNKAHSELPNKFLTSIFQNLNLKNYWVEPAHSVGAP